MFIHQTIIISLLVLLSSCGMMPPLDESEDIKVELPDDGSLHLPPRATEPNDAGGNSSSAVDQLLNQANQAIADNYPAKAAALVERAIRVAPKDPRGYFTLAQIRHRQGQSHQVAQLIHKARSLAGSDKVLLASINHFQNALSLN